MKKILLVVGMVAAIGALLVLRRSNRSSSAIKYRIAILQTASHPALDAVKEGFMQELLGRFGDTVECTVHNAQGSVADAHTIAQQFIANPAYNAFFAIATPAAQALASVEKVRPIIIAAVTDPDSLGLITPTTNVCGVQDMIDVKGEIDMLMQLVPQAKAVGLLYTSGEANSIAMIEKMRNELHAKGLFPIDFAVGSESDIYAVVDMAARKTDLLLAPTDNTIASTITLVASIALKHKKPLIVSDNMLVAYGALAARGVDYKESGKQAAEIAHELLVEGKKPYELPIVQGVSKNIIINKETLAALGLAIPAALQKDVIIV